MTSAPPLIGSISWHGKTIASRTIYKDPLGNEITVTLATAKGAGQKGKLATLESSGIDGAVNSIKVTNSLPGSPSVGLNRNGTVSIGVSSFGNGIQLSRGNDLEGNGITSYQLSSTDQNGVKNTTSTTFKISRATQTLMSVAVMSLISPSSVLSPVFQ